MPRIGPRWLLLSDIHFQHFHLDRIIRTGDWVVSVAQSQPNITRAVICGDILTARTAQPTHVLSACYRFLHHLSQAVPCVDILLGNHDLAYRRDYATTALDAVAMAPHVSLHTEVAGHEWDGRRVLIMPFRETQNELIRAVDQIHPHDAAQTLGFGHLAIHRAILQRHVIRPETGSPNWPTRYSGLTGPDAFAPLARTFTGHFHSHQTILQPTKCDSTDEKTRLQGSLTYLGSPLQLTWSDLLDTQRGVVLLDPVTLDFELLVNPHAVGYGTIDVQDILDEKVDTNTVGDRHVMITGNLSRQKYVAARHRLLSLGARSVRDWSPIAPAWQTTYHGLGKTALPSDSQQVAGDEQERVSENADLVSQIPVPKPPSLPETVQQQPVDLTDLFQEYVSNLILDSSLNDQRDTLIQVGKRLFRASMSGRNQSPETPAAAIHYKDLLDMSSESVSSHPLGDLLDAASSRKVFVAQPTSLTISNFLGIQGTLTLDFTRSLQPGLTFVVGDNGSGKSTLIEAIVWCQFGQCIRSGLSINDVVNDVVGENCSVRLSFANGYTISRYRKHKEYRNRVIVERDGVVQTQLEGPNIRSTQASINELLGIDYETFVRTVVLGHESATSFLSSSPLQRRQIIESLLGLEALDGCAETCRVVLGQMDKSLADSQTQLDRLRYTIDNTTRRIQHMRQRRDMLHREVGSIAEDIKQAQNQEAQELSDLDAETLRLQQELVDEDNDADLGLELARVSNEISQAQAEMAELSILSKLAQVRSLVNGERLLLHKELANIQIQNKTLEADVENLLVENDVIEFPRFMDEGGLVLKWRELFSHPAVFAQRMWMTILVRFSKSTVRTLARAQEHLKAVADASHDVSITQEQLVGVVDKATTLRHRIATQTPTSEKDIQQAMSRLTMQEAFAIPHQLSTSVDKLRLLTDEQSHLQAKDEEQRRLRIAKKHNLEQHMQQKQEAQKHWNDQIHQLRLSFASKEREMSTYKHLMTSETATLQQIREETSQLQKTESSLQSNREIMAFWQTAFSRRRVASSTATFRGFVLGHYLGELNRLLVQILAVLYSDTHHARNLASDVVRCLLDSDSDSENVSVGLDPSSLSISPALSYAKKSGGERKRIDLTLFFALLRIGEARSAHRAGYMLVDEVFDSLDGAGQAAVVRWCAWLTERVGHVVVVTHSEQMLRFGDDGVSVRMRVLKAMMGGEGTELESDGRRIGLGEATAR